MPGKNELQSAIRLALIFLVIGVGSYAAAPSAPPEAPLRIVFQNMGGRVPFDHAQHATEGQIGLDCLDCHHAHDEAEMPIVACGVCHVPPLPPNDPEAMRKPLPEDIAEGCTDCHDPLEDVLPELTNRKEAFHGQCITCHEEYGEGPVECLHCHVKVPLG